MLCQPLGCIVLPAALPGELLSLSANTVDEMHSHVFNELCNLQPLNYLQIFYDCRNHTNLKINVIFFIIHQDYHYHFTDLSSLSTALNIFTIKG